MWTPTTRRQHSRDGLRYETDLTDAEWAVMEPLLPLPSRRGRPPKWAMREIFNAIFYVLRGGIAWSLLPKDLPPKSTVFGWFCTFRNRCLFAKLNFALVAIGHALTDTDGRALLIEPHRADIQDRDAAGPVLQASRAFYPFVEHLFADSAYAGERVAAATQIEVEIVRKLAGQVGFVLLPRRWVIERFFAWINRNRRLAKDVEATIDSARAFLYAAAIMLLVRRIARAS